MTTKTARKVSEAELVSELGALQDEPARRNFLARHKSLLRSEVIERLAPLVVERIRVDAKQALLLSEGTLLIARRLRRKEEIALALRAKANALFASDDNLGAVEHHDQAFKIYEALKIWREAARTLNNSTQPLTLLGENDRALPASDPPRQVFTRRAEN